MVSTPYADASSDSFFFLFALVTKSTRADNWMDCLNTVSLCLLIVREINKGTYTLSLKPSGVRCLYAGYIPPYFILLI